MKRQSILPRWTLPVAAAALAGVVVTRNVEPGKRADLVLLGANPLADIANTTRIDAVVFGGKVIERRELDRMIARGRSAVLGAP